MTSSTIRILSVAPRYFSINLRGSGHAAYIQNDQGTKRFEHNVAYRGCGWNFDIYTQAGEVKGIDLIVNKGEFVAVFDADIASRWGCRLPNGRQSVITSLAASIWTSNESTMTVSVGAASCANCGFDSCPMIAG